MRISICIPQYNRISFLIESLERIAKQTYPDIEVCVSDDASRDNSYEVLAAYAKAYRYPLRLRRNEHNMGYDRNLREAMGLATGEYILPLGNDDTLNLPTEIADLVDFLERSGRPEIGLTNFASYGEPRQRMIRVNSDTIVGAGPEVAMKYYASFVFVGASVFSREHFWKYNTDRYDGTVYVQMYLALRTILGGGRLFLWNRDMVLCDLTLNGKRADTWRDWMHNDWSRYKKVDGGIPQTIRAVVGGFTDAGFTSSGYKYKVMRKYFRQSFPYWLLEYRGAGGFVNAVGLAHGLKPSNVLREHKVVWHESLRIHCYYIFSALVGLTAPCWLHRAIKGRLYRLLKRYT